MPQTLDGSIKADIVMEPASVVSRLNVSRLYEQYFCGMSRKTQQLIKDAIGVKQGHEYTTEEINKGFEILLGLLKIIGTEQYDAYAALTSEESKREIIHECVHKEVYILYRVSSKKGAYQIVKEARNSIYAPVYGPVRFNTGHGVKISHRDVLIAPTYNVLLNKVANDIMSTSSSKLNHYGLPITVGNNARYRMPYKESSLKNLSETEVRLFTSYAGRKAIAELKDRATSLTTHEAIYKNILEAEYPTNIDDVVGRDKIGYSGGASMELIYNIFNCAGVSIDYVDEKKKGS